ncbi:hypothetical protein [Methanoculleus bourgensis]|jgi:hypothetical protein|uniref:Uncharacterized protein n=1 Tax=Methanoculleus bourgensis TaxID=83986 RepID=A0A0X3BQP3_9EURY|nr:hypothetical protein [Methanoculleus bourgensis]CVK34140.1 protein of unknown function [Methanoculleus bourgensis]
MIIKERFVEDDPATLAWSRELITPEEKRRAEDIFTWITQH